MFKSKPSTSRGLMGPLNILSRFLLTRALKLSLVWSQRPQQIPQSFISPLSKIRRQSSNTTPKTLVGWGAQMKLWSCREIVILRQAKYSHYRSLLAVARKAAKVIWKYLTISAMHLSWFWPTRGQQHPLSYRSINLPTKTSLLKKHQEYSGLLWAAHCNIKTLRSKEAWHSLLITQIPQTREMKICSIWS